MVRKLQVSIEGFVKIATIGTMTIPDRQKTIRTVSSRYLHDTGIILVAILEALAIPGNTNCDQVCQVLFGIVRNW